MTADEEKENLREDIEMLKEELKAAEGRIKELENL
jgi:poly(3-hydroxyalkanoate) synthetase